MKRKISNSVAQQGQNFGFNENFIQFIENFSVFLQASFNSFHDFVQDQVLRFLKRLFEC